MITETKSPTDAVLKLWVVLTRAQASVAAVSARDLARHGLTEAEFGVLEALYHKGPLLLGNLQRKILASSGGITYLMDRLAERGLADRLDCPSDRRARYAALTKEGERLMARVFPQHAAALAEAMAGLTPVEQARAATLLKKLGRHASRRSEEARRG
jgi:MarR family transcriptional regulator, 2-MHQ and catechol-resistance regulon repressor